jgi:hypothetical protein
LTVAVQTRIDERTVVGLWERQQIPPAALGTLGLRVIFRGMPSDAGGPDYQDAVVSIGDKRLLTGDVEFHVDSADWYRHGHHLNPRYNRLILHVVWTDAGTETVTLDGRAVPVLALDACQGLFTAVLSGGGDVPAEVNPCWSVVASLPTGDLLEEVRRLGVQRFNERIQRFTSDLEVEEPDQVAYTALLEGLGYASNRRAFAQLADAVPYAWLQSLSRQDRLSTMLDAARLGPTASVPPPVRLPEDVWRLSMLRPANHPARRLHGLVLLLARMKPSLAAWLIDVVAGAVRPADLRKELIARVDGDTLIGPGRADELAVSVVLPLVAALEPEQRHAALLFDRYPSPPPNRWTRHMLNLFKDAGHGVSTVRTAREHQGMHHLYHAYCRNGKHGACSVCRLADVAKRS